MLPFQARVDLGAMAMKECSAFPKAPASLKPLPLDGLVSYPGHLLLVVVGGLTSVQSVYSTALADWAMQNVKTVLFQIIQFSISTV